MKKFQFSLKKLLDYKQQVLDSEKNELSLLRNKKREAEEELLETRALLKKSNKEYIRRMEIGLSAQEMIIQKRYLKSLTDSIVQLQKIISIYEDQIEKQLLVVVEATKEVSTMEKLEEKQLSDYNDAVRKSEENFIQEYVTNSKHYST